MTWQDELRQLDEELASGRITADEYRMRRDRVTAAAANPSAAVPQTGASPQPPTSQPAPPQVGESTQLIPPVAGGAPTPPVNQQHGDADRTQAVNPAWMQGGQPGDAERTQAVRPPGFPPPYSHPPVSPPGGFPQQYQQGWGDETLPPQWAGQELPAAAPWATSGFDSDANDPWGAKQGPEVFEEGGSKTGKIVAIVVAVVVLAGLGVGAYFLWGKDSGGTPAAQASTTPTTTTSTKAPNPMGMGDVPGAPQIPKINQFSDVASLNYLTQEETAAYQAAHAGKAGMIISQLSGGGQAIVLVVKANSPAAAKTAAQKLAQLQLGYQATEVPDMADNVKVTATQDNARAHYSSGDLIVRIEVRNASSNTSTIKSVIQSQLAALPADD